MTEPGPSRLVRVWDLPVRLFHWALVVFVTFSFITAELDELDWHMRSGFCVFALVLFRLLWGVFGSETARFAAFIRGPGAAWRYLRSWRTTALTETIGHNPAGGWSVAAMLVVLCAQVGTGLFANDDISTQGPLAQFVDHRTSLRLTGLHARSFWLLAALVGLHVTTVALYRLFAARNLVAPMISGRVRLATGILPPRMRPLWLAGLAFAASAGVAWYIASFGD